MIHVYLSIAIILFAVKVEGLRCYNCTYAEKPGKDVQGGDPNCAEPFDSSGVVMINCNDQCVKRVLRSENSVTQRTCHKRGTEKCTDLVEVRLERGLYRNSMNHDVVVSQHCCDESRCNGACSNEFTTLMFVVLATISGLLS